MSDQGSGSGGGAKQDFDFDFLANFGVQFGTGFSNYLGRKLENGIGLAVKNVYDPYYFLPHESGKLTTALNCLVTLLPFFGQNHGYCNFYYGRSQSSTYGGPKLDVRRGPELKVTLPNWALTEYEVSEANPKPSYSWDKDVTAGLSTALVSAFQIKVANFTGKVAAALSAINLIYYVIVCILLETEDHDITSAMAGGQIKLDKLSQVPGYLTGFVQVQTLVNEALIWIELSGAQLYFKYNREQWAAQHQAASALSRLQQAATAAADNEAAAEMDLSVLKAGISKVEKDLKDVKKLDDAAKLAKKVEDVEKAAKAAKDAEKAAKDAREADRVATRADETARDAEHTADRAENSAQSAEKSARDCESRMNEAGRKADAADRDVKDLDKVENRTPAQEAKLKDARARLENARYDKDMAGRHVDGLRGRATQLRNAADEARSTATRLRGAATEARTTADAAQSSADSARSAADGLTGAL